MEYILGIYKNGKFFKEVKLNRKNDKYIYKWAKVDVASYFFTITKVENTNRENFNITYNHTSPFASEFRAYADSKSSPKTIAGIQSGIDVLVVFNPHDFSFLLQKKKFVKFNVDISKFGLSQPKIFEISGDFNNWYPETEPISHIKDNVYEVTLNVENGFYQYKFLIDHKWYPEKNEILVVGENGNLFPKGELGSGKFVNEINKNINTGSNISAILHDMKKLIYFNKITEKEFEMGIRTQRSDVERVYISVIPYTKEGKGLNRIYELERYVDYTNSFDYFKRMLTFSEDVEGLEYFFILEDGGVKNYYGVNGLEKELSKPLIYSKKENEDIFYIPYWSREAIWYNIFPDRFYNGDVYNDPIFNEFGPEKFRKNSNYESKFVKDYRWNNNEYALEFERNRWCSDFSDKTNWEIHMESNIDYSLKYARMYGGDLKGIKEKIPYLKKLGINAVWLNPVFYSFQNHKYGANDFRHISPDFGTIRTSGKLHNVYIDPKNEYGNKSYLDVLGKNSVNNSELELLEVNLTGENKGKNGYFETDDPKTWVWTESDLIMIDLIKELHKNGIRVIFDAVFNHSSNYNFAFNLALSEGKDSKYANWYKFNDYSNYIEVTENMNENEAYSIINLNRKNLKYNGWAGIDTLPVFNSFNEEWKDYIFNITRKWMLGPDGKEHSNWQEDDGIDGWRLDVPNNLENQMFWKEWRHVVKKCKKESYITAELWSNAGDDINSGDKFDAVMNYEWLKAVIGYFINQGSDFNESYKLTAEQFLLELREKRTWYPLQAVQACQNLNGSHDTDRLYSRIVNDKIGRNLEEGKQYEKGYNIIRPDLARNYHPNTTIDWKNSHIKPKDILKLISIFQMTYIGAPMIYYGDEVGMWGATDPYCRKPMLWDEFWYDDEKNTSYVNNGEIYSQKPDMDLFEWYRKIIKIRKEHKSLVYGRIKPVYFNNEKDIIAYERYDKEESIIVVINNSFNDCTDIEITAFQNSKTYIDLLSGKKIKSDINGKMKFDIKAKKGYIFYLSKKE